MGTGVHQQVGTEIKAVGRHGKIRICLIGAGNVATHLARAFNSAASIITIYSHSLDNAVALATELGNPSIATDDLASIPADADFYLVSIKDDCIADVARRTPDAGVWAHTSGSIPITVFESLKSRYGVFYPLQTFSKNVALDISQVPFFIEGNTPEVSDSLMDLARKISDVVEPADSERRKALHIAAVFACNFVNYMWVEADDLLRREGLNIGFMKPLLKETLRKISSVSPADAQTGPARRGDRHIIENHLSQLHGEQHEVYKLLSRLILDKYHE